MKPPKKTDTQRAAVAHKRLVRPLPSSSLPGYQAGYRAGLKRAYYQPTAAEKLKVVEGWLLEQRAELLQRKFEIDRQLAVLSAEEELRVRGFVFPAGFSRTNSVLSQPASVDNPAEK